jgi:hypothetical protein
MSGVKQFLLPLLLAFFCSLVFSIASTSASANAENVTSFGAMSAEAGVRVDDLVVRRVRDTALGNVCYVAQSYAFAAAPHGRVVAIDCLPEKH